MALHPVTSVYLRIGYHYYHNDLAMSRQLPKTTQNEPIKRRPGRPLSYRRKHRVLAKDYVKNYKEHGDKVPSIAGLATFLEKSEDAVYDWVKANIDPEFTEIVNRLRTTRHRDLVNGGLDGSFNASITKLCLVSKHGYSENNQADNSITVNVDRGRVSISKDDQTLTIDQDE